MTLNQVPKSDKSLFRHFAKGFDPDANAFDGVDLIPANNGLNALSAALSTLEGTVCGQMDAGDHRILLVTITMQQVIRTRLSLSHLCMCGRMGSITRSKSESEFPLTSLNRGHWRAFGTRLISYELTSGRSRESQAGRMCCVIANRKTTWVNVLFWQ